MSLNFRRNIESFKCENCGQEVGGNGYTNHCPNCLWSKHVDENPGDRSSICGGLMKPVRIGMKGQESFVVHKCVKCGVEKQNKISDADNREMMMKISSESIFN